MIALILVIFLFCTPALADLVILNNGDRISGTIKSLSDGKLTLSTTYAGKVEINWLDIVKLESEHPLYIQHSGSTTTGTLRSPENGMLEITTPEYGRQLTVALSDIGQIKQKRPSAKEPRKISVDVDFSLHTTSGNTRTDQAYGEGEFISRAATNRYTLGLQAGRARENESDTENNVTVSGKYDRFFARRWYTYGNGTFTYDEFRDLRLRSSLGVGSGFQVWESAPRNLSFEAGLTWVNEDFMDADEDDDNYAALRWAVRFDHWLMPDLVQAFHKHEGLMSLEDNAGLIVRSKTGLSLLLNDHIAAGIQFVWDWDNSPAAGTGSTDRDWLLTLGYHIK